MKEYALYHRSGWKPKRLVVANRDKDAGTVDLADEAGTLLVTSLPLVKQGDVPDSGSWATLEGTDLPPSLTTDEEAAKKAADEAAAKQLADDEAAKKAADEAAAKKGGKH
jgi:hypothetical protein